MSCLRGWQCLALIALIAGCSNNGSHLDGIAGSEAPAANDPWGSGGKAGKRGRSAAEGKDREDLGDIQKLLTTVAEALERPGPYEAPEKSKDWDADAPSWGVLELGGGVVERRAYSLGGGSGTELATLIERLRGFAAQDKLAGVLLRVEPLGISVPDAVELRAAMHALRAAGKPIACHTEGASGDFPSRPSSANNRSVSGTQDAGSWRIAGPPRFCRPTPPRCRPRMRG